MASCDRGIIGIRAAECPSALALAVLDGA